MHTTPTRDPVVAQRPAVPYVGVRRTVTLTTVGLVADRLGDLVGLVLDAGSAPAGPPFLRYEVVDMAAALVVVAGVPVDGPVPTPGDVHTGTLPAGRYATVVHRGHPGTLVGATADLLAWARDRGLTLDVSPSGDGDRWGCRLESYLTDPAGEPDPDRWETELAFRLAG
ncbi:GyrI-like domain-containing protein [Kineococcus sp. SYSU DK002]|uniref:GyrI-like domain-containing protein n=1 Tax=Kineococcus sp. SYSU DK002 TaxID=3383123 RepID=UPI003D7E226B